MDIKTVLISYLITNAICAGIIWALYRQNRKQFKGLDFWLADFVMQFASLLLVVMRGYLPDFVSMTIGNGLAIGGTLALYIGLERFLEKRSNQFHNYLILTAFLAVHTWFIFVHPSLMARNINLSLALVALCAQCAWLMFRRADAGLRPIARDAGFVFAAYVAVNLVRVYVDSVVPTDNDFFRSNLYDTVMVMTYQMLFITLTFSLFMMVNRRLAMNLQEDIAGRVRTEEALRFSEEKFFKAFQSGPDSVTITRLSDGRFVEVNEGFSRATGYSREEALSSTTVALQLWVTPQDRESFLQTLQMEGSIREAECDFRAKSGEIRAGLLSAELIQLGGEPHTVAVIHDVTERKQAEEALKESESKYRLLFETMGQGVVYQDAEGSILSANPAAEKILGLTLDQMQGRTSMDPRWRCIHEDGSDFPGETHPAMVALQQGTLVSDVVMGVFNPETGEYRWIYVDAVPQFRTGELTPHQVYTTFDDFTERKRAEEDLRESEARFRTLIEQSPFSTQIYRPDGSLLGMNQACVNLWNMSPDSIEFLLRSYNILKDEQIEAQGFMPYIRQGFEGKFSTVPVIHYDPQKTASLRRADIAAKWVKGYIWPITNKDGRIVNVVLMHEDITERMRAENELHAAHETLQIQFNEINALKENLQEQVLHDPLTNLHNRRYLDEMLGHEVARAKRERYPISVMMIDIDHFKEFNDIYGHPAGDEVLKSLSHLLIHSIRQGDIACRYGGEEFLVIMIDAYEADVERRAETICRDFSRLRIRFEEQGLSATISVGVAFYPKHSAEIQQVIVAADTAMYQAKQAGRDRVQVWRAG